MSAQVFGMTPDETEFWTFHGRVYRSYAKANQQKKEHEKLVQRWIEIHGEEVAQRYNGGDNNIYHVTGLVFTPI